ncbi:DNA methylase [Pseudomonas marginalis]|uniref:site-specific DNA-methyltransferase (adenine-specific) n=1 Tax=Pseudomonas marginalis TaxID=298 RepID=A0A9X9BNU6_PSEMA|nr:N-6 DNA methylase [Pseudomonas marginalis]TWR54701.1 DNA methylase [Pseudomonas marginalis]SEB46442.1 Methyltransferase domain-containing protein [Pseudomonas marginalis]
MNENITFERWLEVLGYRHAQGLHVESSDISLSHRYRSELNELLRPDGQVRAKAVFEVDGVPAVAFFDNALSLSTEDLNRIRQKIWNQNLISLVIVMDDSSLTAYPPAKNVPVGTTLSAKEAITTGYFSLAEISSSDVQRRLPKWFSPGDRVDRQLLKNLGLAIEQLTKVHVARAAAQGLLGQILFISYLEHRNIVSEVYRTQRDVEPLHSLVASHNTRGIEKLIEALRKDFNGDFLSLDHTNSDWWSLVSSKGLDILGRFLDQVDLDTGQQSLWNYDFSFIPVELLSGIYESFIGERQSILSAYYTPRHLANFVIDEAFHTSLNPANETVFDPACGSGILLTTAYRRLLQIQESQTGECLDLAGRIKLLKEHIFGADISEAACRVTAFSLYLSLLEDLKPADIALLQESEQVKLPTLRGINLLCGEQHGDFFAPENLFATSQRFSLIISNPPWSEPAGSAWSSADVWAKKKGVPRARRQLAGDFAFRALESVSPNGRICLIMPISLLIASTSRPFIQGWLALAKIDRFINFGDLHNFIFETAEHSCAVITSRPRTGTQSWSIPADEHIEYWAPKVDASLAFGRLALSPADRHLVPAQAYYNDPTRLVTLMWGNEFDIALCERLRAIGQVKDLFNNGENSWRTRKGVHLKDKHAKFTSDAAPLKKIGHILVESLKSSSPVLLDDEIQSFPEGIESVVNLTDDLWDVFHGPRILFTDGFDSSKQIRAAYIDRPASFTSSIGVISGPESDRELLRFMAAYLRSDLATYFLLMRAFQVTCDRNRVTLGDIEQFPFFAPDDHFDPSRAREIISEVSLALGDIERPEFLRAQNHNPQIQKHINTLIHEYFGLSAVESALVTEANTILVPSVRPRGYKSINTEVYKTITKNELKDYAETLSQELGIWRSHLNGEGSIAVKAWTVNSAVGRVAVAAITLSEPEKAADFDEKKLEIWVKKTMEGLNSQGLLPAHRSETVAFLPDVTIQAPGAFLLLRPPFRRMWLKRSAMRDARSIVELIHREKVSAE